MPKQEKSGRDRGQVRKKNREGGTDAPTEKAARSHKELRHQSRRRTAVRDGRFDGMYSSDDDGIGKTKAVISLSDDDTMLGSEAKEEPPCLKYTRASSLTCLTDEKLLPSVTNAADALQRSNETLDGVKGLLDCTNDLLKKIVGDNKRLGEKLDEFMNEHRGVESIIKHVDETMKNISKKIEGQVTATEA